MFFKFIIIKSFLSLQLLNIFKVKIKFFLSLKLLLNVFQI